MKLFKREGRPRKFQFIALLAVVPVVLFSVGSAISPSPAEGGPKRSSSALRDIPGLGRDYEGTVRDEMIALWETFDGETHLQECMKRAGYIYDAEASFPAESIVAVAKALDVSPDNNKPSSGSDKNRDRENKMSRSKLNSYSLALYGETAKDIETAKESGGVTPQERSNFAQGGCVGKADKARSHVFDIRSQVQTSQEKERKAKNEATKWTCSGSKMAWVDNPNDLEELGSRNQKFTEAEILGCEQEIDKQAQTVSLAIDEAVYKQNRRVLQAHQAKYARHTKKIKRDKDFISFLQTELPQALDAMDEANTLGDDN